MNMNIPDNIPGNIPERILSMTLAEIHMNEAAPVIASCTLQPYFPPDSTNNPQLEFNFDLPNLSIKQWQKIRDSAAQNTVGNILRGWIEYHEGYNQKPNGHVRIFFGLMGELFKILYQEHQVEKKQINKIPGAAEHFKRALQSRSI